MGVRGAVVSGEKLFELRSAAAGVVGVAADRSGFRD